MAITRDGTRAISGDHQGVLRLWDLKSGACIGQRSTNSRQIWSVAVSPDGKQALSGGQDGVMRLWQIDH